MSKHNFRELSIWKESIELVKQVYGITGTLPMEEKFGLVSQMNRCAVSIPSNIAEGCGRPSLKDFQRFLTFSLSSSYELETQLILISELYGIDITMVLLELKKVQNKIGGFKRKLNNTP